MRGWVLTPPHAFLAPAAALRAPFFDAVKRACPGLLALELHGTGLIVAPPPGAVLPRLTSLAFSGAPSYADGLDLSHLAPALLHASVTCQSFAAAAAPPLAGCGRLSSLALDWRGCATDEWLELGALPPGGGASLRSLALRMPREEKLVEADAEDALPVPYYAAVDAWAAAWGGIEELAITAPPPGEQLPPLLAVIGRRLGGSLLRLTIEAPPDRQPPPAAGLLAYAAQPAACPWYSGFTCLELLTLDFTPYQDPHAAPSFECIERLLAPLRAAAWPPRLACLRVLLPRRAVAGEAAGAWEGLLRLIGCSDERFDFVFVDVNVDDYPRRIATRIAIWMILSKNMRACVVEACASRSG